MLGSLLPRLTLNASVQELFLSQPPVILPLFWLNIILNFLAWVFLLFFPPTPFQESNLGPQAWQAGTVPLSLSPAILNF